MVNIKDIARACHVSTATVSRALRGTDYVSKEKKEEILAHARKMEYIVDNNAQILKNGKSNTIGIIVSDIENFFYNMVLENLITEFKKYGYRVVITYSFEDSQTERDNFKFLLSSKVDAIIFTPISNNNLDMIDIIRKRKIPLLQLFRQAYPNVDAICVDDGYGAYLATKHLLNSNHKRIMLLSVKVDFTPSRSKGYRKAMEENQLPIDEDLIQRFPIGTSIESKIVSLIKKYKPDAIIAGTNTFGLEAIQAMNKLDYNLPIVIFDNLEWLKILGISTIAQPVNEIYLQTVENIISKLSDEQYMPPEVGSNIRIKPELIVRKSS